MSVRAARSDNDTTRLEAFSDGVFAIAITLLVLTLKVPSSKEGDLLDALLDQWVQLVLIAGITGIATLSVALGLDAGVDADAVAGRLHLVVLRE